MGYFWEDEERRRTPTKALRMIVYRRDKGVYGICHGKVDPFDFELAHNRAHSRGGKLTVTNTFVAHPSCNRSQGTLSRIQVRRALGIETKEDKMRKALKGLNLQQLRYLAQKRGVKVKGAVTSSLLWGDSRSPPSGTKYVNTLAKVVSESDITLASKQKPKVRKKSRRRNPSDWSLF
ncbi:MAG: hypothetical protein HYU02_01795 [Thaumarchaeota archaeon]|nr:hypothetical protein [Nitrososphaerota archaeon]